MSKYTTELRYVVESKGRDDVKHTFSCYNLSDFLTVDQIDSISKAGIWSKEKLADKIIDHFYFREIGFETWENFAHHTRIYMKEIMEKYLPIIYSNSIKFDPLVNVDYSETFERESQGSSEADGNSNSNSQNNGTGSSVDSVTPNVGLDKLREGKYASSASVNDSENSITDETFNHSESTAQNKENYIKKVKGNSGVSATAQALIKQYRDVIYDVDNKIINDMEILFMSIF